MTIQSFVTSTPHKENLSSFFNNTKSPNNTVVMKPSNNRSNSGGVGKRIRRKSSSRLAEFSDEEDLNRTPVVTAKSRQERRKSTRVKNTAADKSLNVSKYSKLSLYDKSVM